MEFLESSFNNYDSESKFPKNSDQKLQPRISGKISDNFLAENIEV